MTVSRLRLIPGIGVDRVGDSADQLQDPDLLRLENLDTDIAPPLIALERTRSAIDDDSSNSYLPFQGHDALRQAATRHVERLTGPRYDWRRDCVITAGGLNGITNVLLATLEQGDEVILADPIYAGLVNRVHLAGGVPVFASMTPSASGWQIDPDVIADAVTTRTRALLMMSPAMPSGAVIDRPTWLALAELAARHNLWIIVDAAMERIRFDDQPPFSPASISHEIAGRVITVGSASKELRLIGWRVGWVVGPSEIMADVHTVGLTNVVCQVGIAQQAVAAALAHHGADADVAAATNELRSRRDMLLSQLDGHEAIVPHGGWSLLLNCRPLGLTPADLSALLLAHAKIAATPMNGWGPSGENYLRFVFANERVDRLSDVGLRFAAALSNRR